MLEKGRKRNRKQSTPGVPPSRGAPRSETNPSPTPDPVRQAARPAPISAEERRHMIAEAAYFRAQRREFREGDQDRDWIEAEAEIDALLLDRR